jgi:DNA-binding winged helix-turn-helix (wHTH) protein/Tfp pilus assembly protein PilF
VRHRFGPFVLASDRLTAAGRTVHLPAKPLALLRALLERPGDTVDKRQLSLSVWGRPSASDQSIARSVFLLRQALDDHAPAMGACIETVYGRGYRFVAPVVLERDGGPLRAVEHGHATGDPADTPARRKSRGLTLQVRALLARGTPRLRDAFLLGERAVAADPSYAPALASLAECHLACATSSLVEPREAVDRARALLRGALRIAPHDGRAQACMGLVHSAFEWNVPLADEAFARACSLAPADALVRSLHGRHLLSTGVFGRALEELDVAVALDAANLALLVHRAFADYCADRPLQARARCRELLRLEPDHPTPRLTLALMVDDPSDALEAQQWLEPFRSATDPLPQLLPIVAHVDACLGDTAAAASRLAELERRHAFGRTTMPTLAAQVALRLGQVDLALLWLDRAIAARCPWVAYAAVLPGLRALHANPRFREIARALGRDLVPATLREC